MSEPENTTQDPAIQEIVTFIAHLKSGIFHGPSVDLPTNDSLKPIVDALTDFAHHLRVQSEEQEKLNEMKFIVDSLGIGFWKWNLETNELDWDQNMYRLYGFDRDKITSTYDAWQSSLTSDSKSKIIEEINTAVNGGESFDTAFQMIQKNTGRIREIRSVAFVIKDSNDKATMLWGMDLDRSREVAIENELKNSTKFLEQTGALAKVGGWELDLETGQVHMTKQTQILHEIDEDYVPPKYATGGEWYPPEVWPTIQSAVQKAIEEGVPYDLEAPFITAKRRRIWVRVQGFPLIENGKVVKLQGTFQDISERKLSEEILRRAKEDLERERIKAVRSAKLASLGEMSAGIAHEINNPLTIIMGTTRVLTKFLDDPEKLTAKIEYIQSAAERIAKIVRSLRKFSRTSDRSDYKPCSLADCIKEAIILTNAKAQRHSTKVDLDYVSPCYVLCDEIEMEQVFVNLINNAIDAVKILAEKWVRIQLREVGESIVIRIRDSGPPISPEVQQKLFQPFFTTKPVGQGTGLGLSIVKGILDEHGAVIELVADESNTCFEIRMPTAYVQESSS